MDLRERVATSRHPWEIVRAEFFRSLIISHLPSHVDSVLDVGSGDGWFADQMLDAVPTACIDCWDINYTHDDLAQPLPSRIHRRETPPDRRYDVVIALDVLEHIEHDRTFVDEVLVSAVAAGGVLIVSVPAVQALFTNHDRLLGHYRRHSAATLRALLTEHFDIVDSGSLFTSLVGPRAGQAAVERLRHVGLPKPGDEVESQWTRGPLVTRAVLGTLRVDARLGRWLTGRWALPGLSRWAVCRPKAS